MREIAIQKINYTFVLRRIKKEKKDLLEFDDNDGISKEKIKKIFLLKVIKEKIMASQIVLGDDSDS